MSSDCDIFTLQIVHLVPWIHNRTTSQWNSSLIKYSDSCHVTKRVIFDREHIAADSQLDLGLNLILDVVMFRCLGEHIKDIPWSASPYLFV